MVDENKNATLSCFVCEKAIESAFPEFSEHESVAAQPYGATQFYTSGHYGSTIFDPFEADLALIINICDSCLLEKGKDHLVALDPGSGVKQTYWTSKLPEKSVDKFSDFSGLKIVK